MQPRSGDERTELEGRQEPRLVKALEMVAPGTALREGIDNIIHARSGALIAIGDPEELSFLYSGGIKLDIDYTPALLYQVAKMDGAIILSSNATKICWANVQLMPDPTIMSLETGTRHRTAERVSKQTGALVIAISQRRDVVSLYLDGSKYILEDIANVLAKANQALATLEKSRSRLEQVSTRLTALEFEGGVTLHDVLTVLQRAELVTRMAVEIERYIVELGNEGRLIEMQLEETMVGVAGDKAALLHDYLADSIDDAFALALDGIARLPHQDLLDFGRLAEVLGYDRKVNTLDYPVSPRGYRILGRIPRLPKLVVQNIVREFRGLDEILAATDPELESVEGVGEIREKNILGEIREYLTIKILHNDMTVMVPCQNAGKAGLRRVIDPETVKKVLAVLAADVSEMPKNWNRRFKHNRDKIKTGDIYELAEVVRNLAVREQDKGLSTGEKQMYTRAKKILASEMMYALDKSEDEAEAYLDELLSRSDKLAGAAT